MRDSVVFYRSFLEAINELEPEDQVKAFRAILEYGLNGEEPECKGPAKSVFIMARPQIDANTKKYENGRRGGRPVSDGDNACERQETASDAGKDLFHSCHENQSETKTEPNNNQSITCQEPNVNVNDNVNVNVNANENDKRENRQKRKRQQREYPYSEVIAYLNAKAGTSFRDTSVDTRKHIRARVDDGFTLDDFKHVIDVKVEEWAREPPRGKPDMRPFIRPSTLFGSNFESYLNQKRQRVARANDFHNFDSRTYDYDALMDQVRGHSVAKSDPEMEKMGNDENG